MMKSLPAVGIDVPEWVCDPKRRAVLSAITAVGLNLAKNSFLENAADATGGAMLCERLRRDLLLSGFVQLRVAALISGATEASTRLAADLACLCEAFVKRRKNDISGVEANCDAATMPCPRSSHHESQSVTECPVARCPPRYYDAHGSSRFKSPDH